MKIPDFDPFEEFDFANVEFDENFHDLFHSLPECIRDKGDWRRHIELAWAYQWRDALRRKTLCRVGWHEPTQTAQMRDGKPQYVQLICGPCDKPLSNPQPY